MTFRGVAAALLALAGALPAWGDREDDRIYGRLRHVEPGVAVQRPDEPGTDEAVVNGPLLPGDRLFTDTSGRVEVQFSDGSVVRLDRRSKLDYEDAEAGGLAALTLWSGSLYLRVADRRQHADFVIETPDGRVDVRESGTYRVDVNRNDTRLLVFEGQARLESARRGVTVLTGESSYTRRGEAPERASDMAPGEIDDDFARWDEERGQVDWRADNRYLPDEIEPYGADLEPYGSWHYEVEVGYVWRPRVAVGWRPYSDGRWVWTAYGWTWIPHEPWGYAPFHYGRWGHSASLGWYWIPGRTWAPAWVSWRTGGDYVGWCALGHGDRPVHAPSRGRDHAVPRSRASLSASVGESDLSGWQFARRADLASRDVARRRVELAPAEAQQTRTLDLSRTRLDRQTQVVDASQAVPRNVRVKPSPGDYVPELASDPRTTIPSTVRRRLPDDRYDSRTGSDAATGARERQPSTDRERETRRLPAVEERRERYQGDRGRERSTGDDGRRSVPDTSARRRSDERSDDDANSRRRAPSESDILRHFFEPLSERRAPSSSRGSDRDGDSARRRRDGDSGRDRRDSDSGSDRRTPELRAPRSEPRHEAPRQDAPRQAPPQQSHEGAVQRQPVKDRDQ